MKVLVNNVPCDVHISADVEIPDDTDTDDELALQEAIRSAVLAGKCRLHDGDQLDSNVDVVVIDDLVENGWEFDVEEVRRG